MTGREKIEAAFSPGGTPEIPAVICYEGIYARDHWDELTSCPWWYAHSPDIDRQLAWRRDVIEKTGQDWFVLPGAAPRRERKSVRIEERADGVWRVDARTKEAERLARPAIGGWSPAGGVHSLHPEKPPESEREIDEAVDVPPEFDRKAFVESGRADLAAVMLEQFGGKLFPIAHVGSPLWSTYYLWGFEEMMTMAALAPELVEHACGRYLARALRQVREAVALGAAGIWIEECLTDYLSPADFARLNVPFVKRVVDEIRARGMKSIYYYCGNPNDRWDELFAPGADALSLEEGKKGFTIDIEEVVERAGGRCAVLGNLDAIGLLANNSENELRAEIARQVAAGRRSGGRFIMSIGSPVTPDTPVERVRRYCELACELGGRCSQS